MSAIQTFFKRIFPKRWAESMEADSRAWKVTCSKCAHVISIWDMGGIRWKATGGKKLLWRCPACRALGLAAVTKS